MRQTPTTKVTSLPYLTADLPGTGGRIKVRPEDFVVEEVPAYEACGEGTHLYLWIEKRGLTTQEAVRRVARALDKRPRDIGYAGMKDAAAVTRQFLSVEHVDPEKAAALELGWVRVLRVDRHSNKIKLGHLRGNRFDLKVRDVDPSAEERAAAIIEVLARRGLPNYFGPQRFGARGDNARIGRALLQGRYDDAVGMMLGSPGPFDNGEVVRARRLFDDGRYEHAADAWPRGCDQQRRLCRALIRSNDARKAWSAVDKMLHRLLLSAAQSDLFNQIPARRIDALDRIECGDIAYKHDNGACFLVEDAANEQPRCEAFEISPTGPLFGRRMTEAAGEPGDHEKGVLADSELQQSDFSGGGRNALDGARRPLRVKLTDPQIEFSEDDHGPYLRLQFELSSGSYATCLTREICKNDDSIVLRRS